MQRPVYKFILKLTVTLVALLIPAAPALAEETANVAPVLNLSVLGAVHAGEPVQFSGSSAYTSPEQLYLTVTAVPHATGCSNSSAAPAGADSVLTNEPVDNFLSITDLSDNLETAGQWVLCGYLTNGSSATIAAASVPFTVSPGKAKPHGPRGHQSQRKKPGKHSHGKKKHGKKHHKH